MFFTHIFHFYLISKALEAVTGGGVGVGVGTRSPLDQSCQVTPTHYKTKLGNILKYSLEVDSYLTGSYRQTTLFSHRRL